MIFSDSFNGIDARIGCRSSVVEARKFPKHLGISWLVMDASSGMSRLPKTGGMGVMRLLTGIVVLANATSCGMGATTGIT